MKEKRRSYTNAFGKVESELSQFTKGYMVFCGYFWLAFPIRKSSRLGVSSAAHTGEALGGGNAGM